MNASLPLSTVTVQNANVAVLRQAAALAAVNSAVYDIEPVNAQCTVLCANDSADGPGVVHVTDSSGAPWDLCTRCAVVVIEDLVRVPDSHTDVEVSW